MQSGGPREELKSEIAELWEDPGDFLEGAWARIAGCEEGAWGGEEVAGLGGVQGRRPERKRFLEKLLEMLKRKRWGPER